jgi:hypothetical protein
MSRLYEPHYWTCHWSTLTGPGGARTVVWICEYPYRTIRTTPCEDCPGCATESMADKSDPRLAAHPSPSKRLH